MTTTTIKTEMTTTTNRDHMSVINAIANAAERSARAWEAARDSALLDLDARRARAVRVASEECAEHYAAAMYGWHTGQPDQAIARLQGAAEIEREWGDDAHAREAMNAVARA